MKQDECIDLMFEKYKQWLDKGVFTREYAAFELMKRNPYFMNLVTLYRLYDGKNRDKLSSVKYYKDDIIHTLNQVFLYTGWDIATGKETMNQQLSNWIDFDDSCAEEHYSGNKIWYSHIYNKYAEDESPEEQINNALEINRDKIKKMYPVDLDEFSDKSGKKRWLSHLLPATYLKINPLDSNEVIINKLKSYLAKAGSLVWNGDLNAKFDKNLEVKFGTYSAMSMPEIILKEEDSRIFTFDNGKYYDLPTARSLIMYDLVEVFGITSVEKLSTLLESKLGSVEFEHFMPYFDYRPASKNREIKLKTDYISKKKQEIINLISGGYLKLIYSDESIYIHKRLVRKNFSSADMSEIDNANVLDMSILREDFKSIEPSILFNLASLDEISIDEYRVWISKLHTQLNTYTISSNVYKVLLI